MKLSDQSVKRIAKKIKYTDRTKFARDVVWILKDMLGGHDDEWEEIDFYVGSVEGWLPYDIEDASPYEVAKDLAYNENFDPRHLHDYLKGGR